MIDEEPEDEFDIGDVNDALIQHAFRQANIHKTSNTADEDFNLIMIYHMHIGFAQAEGRAAPLVTPQLVAATQRTVIRYAARGERFLLVEGELNDVIKQKEAERAAGYHLSANAPEENFLDRILALR